MTPTMAHPNLHPLSPAHRGNCFHRCLHTLLIALTCVTITGHVRAARAELHALSHPVMCAPQEALCFLGPGRQEPGSTV